jgi:O-methyltransferase
MNPIKEAIKRSARLLGYDIVRAASGPDQSSPLPRPHGHEEVRPAASYSPWTTDRSFQATLAAIQGFTLVDQYRCFELWKLVEQVAKLPEGSIIEVGVWRGGTGALIATQAKNCGIREKVFLCDTFSGVVKAGVNDSVYKGGEHADTSKQIVEDLVGAQMKLDNVEILQGIFPDDSARYLAGMRFRFCHVDVDVYQSASDIVDWIWDRIVTGGVMVYDDYGFAGCDGITRFVNEQATAEHRLVIHNLNGHAIVVKI